MHRQKLETWQRFKETFDETVSETPKVIFKLQFFQEHYI